MRILITGGAGFIGMHVCREMQTRGHEVSVLDNLSTGVTENVPSGSNFYHLDITSPQLTSLMVAIKPDTVIHLAAQVSVTASVASPAADSHANVFGTVQVLEAARAAKVRRFVFASSAAVYGTPDQLPLTESSPTHALSPYALSKLTAERYIDLLAADAGICPAVLRFANVYGPGQTAHGEAGVVAIFCDQAMRVSAPAIYGDGEQTRDFVYVGDVATAVRMAAEASDQPGTWNVSTGVPRSVNELWHLIRAEAARNIEALQPVYHLARPGDIRHSYLSARRINEDLGWKASTPLATGLHWTVSAARATETEVV